MKKLIEFKNICKKYGEFHALKDLNFELYAGELVVILGQSGAGKSTLLNLLGGMDSATSGEIIVDGKDISNYNDNQLTEYRAQHIGFIFQFYNLIPTLTALENVSLVKDVIKDGLNSQEVLASVGLTEHLNQFPSQLSGGEQQRVSIARAVSKDPLILLCDEPTGALDSETGALILSLLHDMSRIQGRTVIIVTHNAIITPTADRVIHIKNGKIEKIEANKTPQAISEVSW